MLDARHVWVVIPAYNEERSIGDVLEGLVSYPYGAIVVDDGSNDGTSEVALRYPVVVLRHLVNLGQGAAIQTGLDYAKSDAEAQAVVTFDADGQHDPADIANLLRPLASGIADVSLGTRFGGSARVLDMPTSRRLILRMAVLFTRITTGLQVTDTHNGLRAFNMEIARSISISQNRMAHATEILSWIARNRLRFVEVPVTVRYTAYSKQKGQSLFELVNILWDVVTKDLR